MFISSHVYQYNETDFLINVLSFAKFQKVLGLLWLSLSIWMVQQLALYSASRTHFLVERLLSCGDTPMLWIIGSLDLQGFMSRAIVSRLFFKRKISKLIDLRSPVILTQNRMHLEKSLSSITLIISLTSIDSFAITNPGDKMSLSGNIIKLELLATFISLSLKCPVQIVVNISIGVSLVCFAENITVHSWWALVGVL